MTHCTTGEYVFQKCSPCFCIPPWAENQALCLIRILSGNHFLLKDHTWPVWRMRCQMGWIKLISLTLAFTRDPEHPLFWWWVHQVSLLYLLQPYCCTHCHTFAWNFGKYTNHHDCCQIALPFLMISCFCFCCKNSATIFIQELCYFILIMSEVHRTFLFQLDTSCSVTVPLIREFASSAGTLLWVEEVYPTNAPQLLS